MTHIVELRIAADPAAWQQAGFDVDGQGMGRIGTVSLRIDPAPKAAAQPGRHIATIRREAGLAARVALRSPEPTRP